MYIYNNNNILKLRTIHDSFDTLEAELFYSLKEYDVILYNFHTII